MKLGVVGYSTRALVQAAVELGHRAVAIDAFGDQDTIEAADDVFVVDQWPDGILQAAQTFKVDAWLLGGGMENCYELVAGGTRTSTSTSTRTNGNIVLSDLAPVLGPSASEMKKLRTVQWCEALCAEGICWPETRFDAPCDTTGSWLVKSRLGAGGIRVGTYRSKRHSSIDVVTHPLSNEASVGDTYWQRRIAGRVLGVTWILDETQCELFGVTQSLDQQEWPGPTPFIYRGSLGPIPLSQAHTETLWALGQRIQRALPDYRGYLQADLVEDVARQLWLLEFNPRWTAGMEVLHESALVPTQSPLAAHLNAWKMPQSDECSAWNHPPTRLVAKSIHYTDRDVELSLDIRCRLQSLRNWQGSQQPDTQWCFADLPPVAPGAPMRFLAGSPILTVKSRQLGKSIWEVPSGKFRRLTKIE